jgi:hypothetical protein
VLAGALLLLLMSADARRWTQHVHDAVAAVLFGLTGPFSVVLTPLFVARAWHRRTRTAWTLAVLVVACGVVQAEMIRRHPFPMPGDTISPVAALAVPGMRIVGSLLAGSLVPADYPRVIEHILGASTLIGVALLAARRGFGRPERTWLALAFAGLLASSLYRCRYVWPDLCHAGFGSRYFYPLQLAAIWLIIAAANDSRRWIARIATVIAVWMFAINVPRLREPAFDDKHWADYAPKIRAGEAVVVPINPSDWTISFPARPKPVIAPPH